jgi:hypothetical protein
MANQDHSNTNNPGKVSRDIFFYSTTIKTLFYTNPTFT